MHGVVEFILGWSVVFNLLDKGGLLLNKDLLAAIAMSKIEDSSGGDGQEGKDCNVLERKIKKLRTI